MAEDPREEGLAVDVRAAESAGDLDGYDAAIVGGALYAGRRPRPARRFLRRNARRLVHLPV